MHALEADGAFVLEIGIKLQQVIFRGQSQRDDFPFSADSLSSPCSFACREPGYVAAAQGGGERKGGEVGVEVDLNVRKARHGAIAVTDSELGLLD